MRAAASTDVCSALLCSSQAFESAAFSHKRSLELGAGVSAFPSLACAHMQSFSEASRYTCCSGFPAAAHSVMHAAQPHVCMLQVWVTDIDECMEGAQLGRLWCRLDRPVMQADPKA